MTVKKYQELIAWQKGIALVTEVYEVTRSFPRDEIYGLTSQLRRAAAAELGPVLNRLIDSVQSRKMESSTGNRQPTTGH